MRLHHLNCVSSCPLGGRLIDGRSPSALRRGALCCHCLLLETARDRAARFHNQHRLRELRRERPEIELLCAHDPHEFERLAGRAMGLPPPDLRGARAARAAGQSHPA